MKKTTRKPLILSKTTLARLTSRELTYVAGGITYQTIVTRCQENDACITQLCY
jgi:hypothetical protein